MRTFIILLVLLIPTLCQARTQIDVEVKEKQDPFRAAYENTIRAGQHVAEQQQRISEQRVLEQKIRIERDRERREAEKHALEKKLLEQKIKEQELKIKKLEEQQKK